MKKLLILTFPFLALSACSEKAPDVSWYLEHPEEHKLQLQKCSNDPAKLEATAACVNARAAADKKAGGLGNFKKGVGLSGQ